MVTENFLYFCLESVVKWASKLGDIQFRVQASWETFNSVYKPAVRHSIPCTSQRTKKQSKCNCLPALTTCGRHRFLICITQSKYANIIISFFLCLSFSPSLFLSLFPISLFPSFPSVPPLCSPSLVATFHHQYINNNKIDITVTTELPTERSDFLVTNHPEARIVNGRSNV